MIDTVPTTFPRNEWLLCDLIRLLALLEVMETKFSLNTLEPQRVQQLIITGFAPIRSLDNGSWNCPSLSATLGLLLRAPFLDEADGTYILFVQTDLG
jgi:hypothetical protein